MAHSCGWKGDQDADTIFRTERLSKNGIPSIVVRYHNEIFFAYIARNSNADKNLEFCRNLSVTVHTCAKPGIFQSTITRLNKL